MAQRSPEPVERTGKTVDEAVQRALRDLGLDRAEVEVRVMSEGRPGVLGIGAASARVRVAPLARARRWRLRRLPLNRRCRGSTTTRSTHAKRWGRASGHRAAVPAAAVPAAAVRGRTPAGRGRAAAATGRAAAVAVTGATGVADRIGASGRPTAGGADLDANANGPSRMSRWRSASRSSCSPRRWRSRSTIRSSTRRTSCAT